MHSSSGIPKVAGFLMLKFTGSTLPSIDPISLSPEEMYIFTEGQVVGAYQEAQKKALEHDFLLKRLRYLEQQLKAGVANA